MQYDFSGQRVIVTGAAHGFGRAIAQAFAGLGAAVWACDILNDEVRETCSLVKGAGGLCEARTVNVRKRAEVQDFVSEVSSDGKPVQVLVNNAGGVLGQVGRPLEEIDGKDWDSVLEVNLRAVFWMSQAVAPGMKRAGYGRIVNISSGAGLRPSMTGVQGYAAGVLHQGRPVGFSLDAGFDALAFVVGQPGIQQSAIFALYSIPRGQDQHCRRARERGVHRREHPGPGLKTQLMQGARHR